MAYEFALDEIESGNSVLVHCRHGKDRTGLFMAYFLRQQFGLSTADAIERVKAVRPIALTAEGWEDFAIEVLDSCRVSDRVQVVNTQVTVGRRSSPFWN